MRPYYEIKSDGTKPEYLHTELLLDIRELLIEVRKLLSDSNGLHTKQTRRVHGKRKGKAPKNNSKVLPEIPNSNEIQFMPQEFKATFTHNGGISQKGQNTISDGITQSPF